jgi:hypothetical protein
MLSKKIAPIRNTAMFVFGSQSAGFEAALLGVDVAVNKPVSVAVVVVLVAASEAEVAVMVIPGQSFDSAYHTPLMITPSFFKMLLIASCGQVELMSRT